MSYLQTAEDSALQCLRLLCQRLRPPLLMAGDMHRTAELLILPGIHHLLKSNSPSEPIPGCSQSNGDCRYELKGSDSELSSDHLCVDDGNYPRVLARAFMLPHPPHVHQLDHIWEDQKAVLESALFAKPIQLERILAQFNHTIPIVKKIRLSFNTPGWNNHTFWAKEAIHINQAFARGQWTQRSCCLAR